MATPVGDAHICQQEDDHDDEEALAALVAGGGAATASQPPPSQAPTTTASPVAWEELMATRTQAMDVAEARRILASQQHAFEGKDACGLRTLQITFELEMLAKDQEELIDMMSAISDKGEDGEFLNKAARGRCVRGRMHMRALATARARYYQGSPPRAPLPVKKPITEKGDPAFSGARGKARAASLWRVYETNCRIHDVKVKAYEKRAAQYDDEMAKEKERAMSAIKYLGRHFPRRGTYAAAKTKWLARARALAAAKGQKAAHASAATVSAQLWAAEEDDANRAGIVKEEEVAMRRAKRDRERRVDEAIADAEQVELEELRVSAKRGCGTIKGWRSGVCLAVAICKRWKCTTKCKHASSERDAPSGKVDFYDLFHPEKPVVDAAHDAAWIEEWEADAEVFACGAADAPPAVVVAASPIAASRAKP